MSGTTKVNHPIWMSKLEQRIEQRGPKLRCGISLIDPAEAYVDDEGVWWNVVSSGGPHSQSRSVPFSSTEQLAEIRQQSRRLVATNEYAINGIENRTSYVVGVGHHYRASVRKGASAPAELEMQVQQVLDEFQEENAWRSRQQEMIRRIDRDGELFLRYFVDLKGITRRAIRRARAGVHTPQELSQLSRGFFGIQTEPDDVESVLGYFIDGEPVEADAIQHRKANVDRNVKRGLPLYYPVRKNLRRIEKLLRNMSVVSEIQSAIALIRKHRGANRTGVEQTGLRQR